MTKKTRVALVVPAFADGGGVPAVALFVRRIALASGRFDIHVVSLASAANDVASCRIGSMQSWFRLPRSESREWSGVAFDHIGAVMPEFEFQRLKPRAVLSHALSTCDLIQVVCGSPAWANTVIDLGKPVALQVATLAHVERRQRDANPRTVKGWWRKAMTSITNRMDARALRRVDAIQTMNPWMTDYARSLNENRDVDIRYAPPGIDAQRHQPLSSTERLCTPYILCVGRLEDPRKHIGMLLEAYALLPTAMRDRVELVLAGSSAPPDAFQQRLRQLGLQQRVRYIPKPAPDALLDLYQHASVFALPSDEEGFGVVLIEAMACGVPVVATRCGGPDGIVTDGEEGFLVPRNDAEAMSARLATLLDDPRQNAAMGAAARATIERRYDERIAGAVVIDMWERLLNKPMVKPCAD